MSAFIFDNRAQYPDGQPVEPLWRVRPQQRDVSVQDHSWQAFIFRMFREIPLLEGGGVMEVMLIMVVNAVAQTDEVEILEGPFSFSM